MNRDLFREGEPTEKKQIIQQSGVYLQYQFKTPVTFICHLQKSHQNLGSLIY